MRISEELFKAFADTTRLRILHLLANRGPEVCVCDFVAVLEQAQGTISRHLMQLRHQGLVNGRRQGVWMHYSLCKPDGKLHGALLQCLRRSCGDDPQLAEDLRRFDALRLQSSLACCSKPAGACAAKSEQPKGKA